MTKPNNAAPVCSVRLDACSPASSCGARLLLVLLRPLRILLPLRLPGHRLAGSAGRVIRGCWVSNDAQIARIGTSVGPSPWTRTTAP